MSQNTSDEWMQYMLKGEFEAVWKLSDEGIKYRAGKPEWHLPRHFQHIWNGTSLNDKRVLIRCYHGLGDTIHFIRYAPLVKAIAREVIVWAQPEILPLLTTAEGIDKLLPLHDGTPAVEYDVDVEVMELPHVFRTVITNIPSEIPYFRVERLKLNTDAEKIRVGLVWKAGDWDLRRSIPFSMLAPLFHVEGITIYILQANAEQAGWQSGMGINPGSFELAQFAGFVKELDLMISVDSMPAHLAGALGVPVWNLLHAEADWRWMKDRDDSPWYPSMHLFRQKKSGEWGPVIEQVTQELTRLSQLSLSGFQR